MQRTRTLVLLALPVLAALGASPLNACTGIRLTASDGTIVYARTMESALDFQSNLILVPRGKAYVGTLMEKRPGLSWTTKYAFVGPNVFGMPYVADGMNETGLAVGHFVFTDFAQYQTPDAARADETIDAGEVGTFLLGTCSSVPEAIAALRKVLVIAAGSTPQARAMNCFHYFVHDAEGQTAVLEYVGGQLNVHDNPFGVITNSPTFDWHATNLRNTLHLSPEDASAVTIAQETLSGFGHGTGLLGLPGDFTPPSRFVRAFTLKQAMYPAATAEECVAKAFHLLNQFDIPPGAVRAQEGDKTIFEFTNWTTAADLKHLRYYFHTFQSRRIRMVDFAKIDLEAPEVLTIPMREPEVFEDVTTRGHAEPPLPSAATAQR